MPSKRAPKTQKDQPVASPDRQRIVDVARQHFFNHGFRRVTMDDLAGELAVSKKTLYAHFPGKSELLDAVLEDKFAGVTAALEHASQGTPRDFASALHHLLATTQRELDEIKPPFVRDMRLKAPDIFKSVERRRAELIGRHFGKLFVEGQRTGMVRKDIPARLIIEILLGAVHAIMNPPKIEALGLTPKSGFDGIISVILEGALAGKARKS